MIRKSVRKLSYVWIMKPLKQNNLVGCSVGIIEESDL
jgi:hypothetical protein